MADLAPVLEGVELHGTMNTEDAVILEQIRQSIRLGHPQVFPQVLKGDRIALVGSGPSLKDTERELVDLVRSGAKLVTTNGAYQWCLERNLNPSAQIVLDARPSTARFLTPEVHECIYFVASQCHPDTWEMVKDYEKVVIWHAVDPEGDRGELLDSYYLKHWLPIAGGTTVISRAIGLLRSIGYLRYDLFGVDSCWMGDEHHAFAQPENEHDRRLPFTVHPSGEPEKARIFHCAPWHVKQAEDMLQFIQQAGDQFVLNVHGDGLFAYMLQSLATGVEFTESAESAISQE